MPLDRIFIVNRKSIYDPEVVYDKDGNELYFADGKYHKIDRSNPNIYNDKEEARYQTFVYQMEHGSKLSNFKRSKYFEYYYNRAMEENPEFLV